MAKVKKIVKSITIDADKCNGCKACEVICSSWHASPRYSSNNPARSRIRVVRDPLRDIYLPVYAGEYTASAGCTNTVRQVKESYGHPLMMPKTVVLDPRASVHTPEWLFLSTGIRAVDHAVEDICSPQCQRWTLNASRPG